MKSKKLIYMMLSSALLFGSCDDFLDTMPDNRAEVNTADKITSLLVSAYPVKVDMLMTEMASDNVMDNGARYTVFNQEQEDAYLWKDITAIGNDSPYAYWNACYRAIASANQALQAIEDMGNPSSLSAQRGEALMCRAYGHFALANLFCMNYNPETAEKELGLPYSIAPETSVAPHYTRGKLSELYQKINQDIEEGLPLINDNIYKVPKYHFNKKAAYAFAARFNLYYQKFDKVIDYANVVLGSVPEKMLRNWQAMDNLPSNFDVRINAYVSSSETANLLIGTGVSGWGVITGPYSIGERYGQSMELITGESLRALGIWGDKRELLMAKSLWGTERKLSLPKYQQFFQIVDKVAQTGFAYAIPILFTGDETLLCRAEAYALTNQLDKCVADINVWMATHTAGAKQFSKEEIVDYYKGVRTMPVVVANPDQRSIKKKINPQGFTVAAGEMEELIQCILHLRRLETLQDGTRWQDIKRYGIEISHNRDGLDPDILKVGDPRRAIQLPQDVINAGLEPNPRNN